MEVHASSGPQGLPPGTRFGPYAVVSPLAAGGMAELYLAARPGPYGGTELVAVKRMLPHLCWDPEFVRMFLDEVRIAAALQHPNIVRVVDFGVADGGHYLAMEYLHGRTASVALRQTEEDGPLPLDFCLSVVASVADGLAYAHHYRAPDGHLVEVVHRDVSPTNVMITFGGEVKLVDFGIARVTQQTQHTRAGTLKGKVGYMSPEQCRGDAVDRRSDVFGLGILLYELTLGRRAFYGENDFAVMNRVLEGNFVKPSARSPGYPPELEEVIVKALSTEPEDRHDTAFELAFELRRIASSMYLDLSPPRRAAVMQARFGNPLPPIVDLEALDPEPVVVSSSRLGWVGATAGIGLALGVLGFVAGGQLRDEPAAPTPDPVPAVSPMVVAAPVPADAEAKPEPSPAADEPADAEPAAEEGATTGDGKGEGEDEETVVVDGEPEAAAAPSKRRKRRRGKRRKKARSTGEGKSADNLLPPSWRTSG